VFPALALNYLGQGAMVLSYPEALSNPFFLMFPNWALLPVVILATAATIIASQSVITGAFSLVRQAIHLGFLPRFEICYTSETGQIYLPLVNTALLIGVLVLMFVFGSSEALAPAYRVSITGAMIIDTVLAFAFVCYLWNWSLLIATAFLLPLFLIELVFLGANLFKIHHGGYVPILFAGTLMAIMWMWRKGVRLLREKTSRLEVLSINS
jgi:KUP system potassium uptake protein